ncbi:hypothetical protein JCGZ_10393 [Jatropha curcas]|uniref:S-protein homolog n=1 Tax=Jatropha curcas TaxID=180498 RepID=A0A067KU77_JATCU|nr:hypothetical protein JCGZ_10393 [Jatropha curcas]
MKAALLAIIFILISAIVFFTMKPAHILKRNLLVIPKYHVHIVNDLDNDILNVQCKSKDTNLGFHSLGKGEAFEFHFRVNFMGSTKFWCTFNWGPGHGGEYKVFWYGIGLAHKCIFSDCSWFARDDALYLKNKEANLDEKYYYWQS